ncbi:sensor histidine kinase [Virgisporangium aurantiacum]|uniref:histidine kinase n=1 Tax=Virgisporangium aurantiacum TaxID=175570 RepID=A0A8J3Z4T4_9ACTN|nr:sensor histidine kinase [Virgisporangium aurantiacum]GIJ55043.1 two-component sensor histidine kinase [Virgisporangium aurantiacum]
MTQLLRAVWFEPRPAGAPVRVWRDWALVAVLVVAAVLEGVLRPDLPWRVVSVAIAVALVPTVLWRRTRPLLMVAIAFGGCALSPLLTGGELAELQTMGFLTLLPYALFRWGSGREMVLGSAIMLGRLAVLVPLSQTGLGMAAVGVLVLSVAAACGTAMRYRARARQRDLEKVKLLERERLARDLHDTVAHHVSAIAIRAQAGLATMSVHPEAAADALRVIEAEATRTLTEMRTMVRALRRSEEADLAPSPRIADLARLGSGAGPVVDVEIDGDTDDLSPSVGSAIYRLAQESVTNARRHARHATRILVRVAADDTSVRLRVTDDGETGHGGATPGYGLIGMTERADLLGGTCEAGPNPGRGWTVSAVLPRGGAAA